MSSPPESLGRWQLQVPGSTSNLGPGFDQLGLALGLTLGLLCEDLGPADSWRVQIEDRGPERPGEPESEHSAAGLAGDSCAGDLTARALASALPRAPRHVRLIRTSEIPVARGLGSSGAAVAAGLLLADALAEELPDHQPLDPGAQQALGCSLEGHPDNVMASLLGGLVLSAPHPGGVHWQHSPVHGDLGFPVAWPDQPMSTAQARSVLPAQVPLADAIENARRLPVLLRGLAAADGDAIAFGIQDRWHVEARLTLLPGASAALSAAVEAGAYGATLSGSGSALVAVAPKASATSVAEAMQTALGTARGKAHARCPEVAHQAPAVERL